MFTAVEYYAKAAENDHRALTCPIGPFRDAYLNIAIGWRHTAGLAAQHEKLATGFF